MITAAESSNSSLIVTPSFLATSRLNQSSKSDGFVRYTEPISDGAVPF
jgi:hypothetical protein